MIVFFFFNDTATTEIYTLSLHDALPISERPSGAGGARPPASSGWRRRRCQGRRCSALPGRDTRPWRRGCRWRGRRQDRKSTRLNSSHANISYAVFCLKKKKKIHEYNKLE